AATTTTTPTASSTTTTTSTGGGTGACTAALGRVDQWSGGFVANVTVTAGGSSVSGWRVTITLPAGSAYSNGWSAVFSGSGTALQAGNASYNGSLGAGQSAT